MADPIAVFQEYCQKNDVCLECFLDGFDEKLTAGFCFYHSPSATQLAAEVADEMAEQQAEKDYIIRKNAKMRFKGHLANARLLADEAKAERIYVQRATDDHEEMLKKREAAAATADAIYDRMVERLFTAVDYAAQRRAVTARRRKVDTACA